MTLVEYNRFYGDAKLLGDYGDDFFTFSDEDQAKAQGWSAACPVVLRLIKERGAKVMVKRYGEVNFWFTAIEERLIERGMYDLANEMKKPVMREYDEPMGKHDPDWIPLELRDYMFGPGTPEGYALPRLLTAFLGDHINPLDLDKVEERANRAMIALDKLDEAINYCASHGLDLSGLTVVYANLLALEDTQYGQDPSKYLYQLMGTGKLSEDNCRSKYSYFLDLMNLHGRFLWDNYFSLTPEQAAGAHIAIPGFNF